MPRQFYVGLIKFLDYLDSSCYADERWFESHTVLGGLEGVPGKRVVGIVSFLLPFSFVLLTMLIVASLRKSGV